jgi:hypothetical protein
MIATLLLEVPESGRWSDVPESSGCCCGEGRMAESYAPAVSVELVGMADRPHRRDAVLTEMNAEQQERPG